MSLRKMILALCCFLIFIENVKSYLSREFPADEFTSTTTSTTYLTELDTTMANKIFKLKKSSPVINDNQCNSNPCLVI
jgi:hypothetical protein